MRLSTRVKIGFDEATELCSGVLVPRGEMKEKMVTGSMNTHDHDDVSENAAGLWSRSRVLPVYRWVVAPRGDVA